MHIKKDKLLYFANIYVCFKKTNYLNSQNESYITEAGDVESWKGGKVNEDEIKNVKEYIKKLREHEL